MENTTKTCQTCRLFTNHVGECCGSCYCQAGVSLGREVHNLVADPDGFNTGAANDCQKFAPIGVLTLACEAHLQDTKTAIDVISDDGQILAKWNFQPVAGYHPVELKFAPYHNTVGQPMAYYIDFGGWLFWLLDEAGTGAHYDTPTRTLFMLDDETELIRPTTEEINVVDRYTDPDTCSGYRIMETLNPAIITYSDYNYYAPVDYELAGPEVWIRTWRQMPLHEAEDLPLLQHLVDAEGRIEATVTKVPSGFYRLALTHGQDPYLHTRGRSIEDGMEAVRARNEQIAQGVRETLAARG